MPAAPGAGDRNLLLGILALQLDFITRDQLVVAMSAWVPDKARPLGEILQAQQALEPARHALLEALVQEHLRQHGNDPERSLGAVSSLVESVRADLQQLADADVTRSLAHVAADRQPTVRAATTATTAPAALRYRILRPHARGGLGEVFVAEDSELHRPIALKQMQARHADDGDSRARFLREAEITGSLEHPGIVPVYGLGSYADGRPFYAMRFIQGDNLQEAIARFHQQGRDRADFTSLAFRQLLGRFIDVCNAVAYAHSRGVLHRDLKPGNIMLGKFGETLVVDWGLAKAQGVPDAAGPTSEPPLVPRSGSDSSATQAGSAIGTPAYMSPEQAAGRLEQLGPAADVYSLGATLFAMLTNRAPVSGKDMSEVLRKVQRGETGFAEPGTSAAGLPPALVAVCRKAMALAPARRYATPLALAEELEHWLADEPVAAYREPWSARGRRWMRKHPAAVSAIAVTVLVTVTGLGIGVWLLGQKNQELSELVGDLADANAKVYAANEESMNRLVAQYQAAGKPELSLALYEEKLKVTRAKLGPDHPNTLRMMNDLARAHHLAGKLESALPLYEEALELMKAKLRPDHPFTLETMQNLVNARLSGNDTRAALPLIADLLARLRPAWGSRNGNFAGVLEAIGDKLLRARQFAEAEELLREVVAIQSENLPNDWRTFHCKAKLGLSLLGQRKYADAELVLREGFEGMKQRENAAPPRVRLQVKACLAEAAEGLAQLYEATGRNAEARQWAAILARVDGALLPTIHDAATPLTLEGRLHAEQVVLIYQVRLKGGVTYVLDMVSADAKALDPYLIVQDGQRELLARDDNGGGNFNARIQYRPMADGVYRLRATSVGGGHGSFTLRVRPKE